MQLRILTVLACRNGAGYLPGTLAALQSQTRRPDRIVAVDASSSDASLNHLRQSDLQAVTSVPARTSFVQAVHAGVQLLPEAEEHDWLWFLAHDAHPSADALEHLLLAVETSPSVVLVGPKVMRSSDPDTFAEYGETMTKLGRSLRLHVGELDQGQHDANTDAMGVASSGLLIRRDVYEALGGFDPALPSIDAGLDLGVRARLAGHRVALEPGARVRRAGGPELFSNRSVSDARYTAIARDAQLHRRLAYAHPLMLPLVWLAILPQALLRSVMHLLAKRPASIGSEWLAALKALVAFGPVSRARRRIRSNTAVQWADLAGLRPSWRSIREQRRSLGGDETQNERVVDERVGFVEGGTLWVVALAAVLGIMLAMPLIGATLASGGATLPLGTLGEVWADTLYGQRDALGDVIAPADPFSFVIAMLGTVTFWNPSQSIVLLIMFAPALAAATGWAATRRITANRWVPAVGALVWGFSPVLGIALAEGRIGAVVAHLLLPLVVVGLDHARRSGWRGAALAALAGAGVVAGAPSLLPAYLLCTVGYAIIRYRAAARMLLSAVPSLIMFAPLALWQWMRGTPLAIFADPGVPTASTAPSALNIAVGMPDAGYGYWPELLSWLGWTFAPEVAVLIVAAPLLLLAFASPFLRAVRGLVAVAAATAGGLSAFAAAHLAVASLGGEPVTIWAGAGVSFMLLGLLGATSVTLDALDEAAGVPVSVLALTSLIAAVPLVVHAFVTAPLVDGVAEQPSPAIVAAEAAEKPEVGTLVIVTTGEADLQVYVERGSGARFGDIPTSTTTAQRPTEAQSEVGTAAVNLISGADIDPAPLLERYGIAYVLLRQAGSGSEGLHDRAVRNLDASAALVSIGQTRQSDMLWEWSETASFERVTTPWAGALALVQWLMLATVAVISLPSVRRGARVRQKRLHALQEGAA